MSDQQQAERPATFREVFASREYRAIYPASALSWIGDYLAKAAVTALVYHQTHSVPVTAATFAISFLPWVVGGPVLAALAERYPQRTVMITSDLVRMALMATVAIPGVPIPFLLALLFLTALFNPPFEAARSALLPRIQSGDRYIVAVSLQNSTNQAAQLVGYLVGAGVAAANPHVALLIDAGTFAFSACVIGLGVHARPAALAPDRRTHLLRETADGFRIVFGTRALRAIAILVLSSHLFTMPPEGLAAAWAAELESDPTRRGLAQGIIMVANPLGFLIAGLLIGRLVSPETRRRLIRPFAVLAPVALIPALFNPSAIMVAVLAGLCGVCVAGMLPAANGLFVQALPHEYRARAFGVMQSGLQVAQGGSVLVTGILAAHYALPTVVGDWSLFGAALMLGLSTLWPSRKEFAEVIERTSRNNAAVDGEPAPVTENPPPAPRPPSGDQPYPSTASRASGSV